jgi:hypothetical protein
LDAEYAPLPSLVIAARSISRHEPLPQIQRAQSAGIPETVDRSKSHGSGAGIDVAPSWPDLDQARLCDLTTTKIIRSRQHDINKMPTLLPWHDTPDLA